jgi:hypothetical protein
MPSAVITASSSGDNTIVSGQAGYAVRVLYFLLSFSGIAVVNAIWKSDVGGGAVALTGTIFGPLTGGQPQTIDAGEVAPAGRGLFQTASGKALNLNLSAAQAVGGFVVYEMVAQ